MNYIAIKAIIRPQIAISNYRENIQLMAISLMNKRTWNPSDLGVVCFIH
jgi:hypothetical protein